MNTHILSQQFDYFEPNTIDDALQLKATHEDAAAVMAGGTDLLVQMKRRKLFPKFMINLTKIPALRYLIAENGIRIGALTSFREIERSSLIKDKYTSLHEAANSVSSVQIKNMGTLGGNLCNASPAADSAPALIALGATVKLVDGDKERILPLEKFFTGPGKTVCSPKELLVEIRLPELSTQTGSAFVKLGRTAADLAKVSVAVKIVREGMICKECKIALGAVAPIPGRVADVEEILREKEFGEQIIEKASQRAVSAIEPITDIRSSAWYRKEVLTCLVKDAIDLAWIRAEGIGK